jgi:hypothetical protein
MRCIFNHTPFALGAALPPPVTLPHSVRSVPLERLETTDDVRRIIDAMPLVGRRFARVEVRASMTRTGETLGLPTWHLDAQPDPFHPTRPEVHHLFVSGTASLTEFVAEPVALDVALDLPPYARMFDLDAQLRALAPPTVKIPSCRIVTYGRLDLHRATPATHEEPRLLVRVTESDLRTGG